MPIQIVTPRQPKPRVSRMKGHLSKRTAFVRDIVKEVAGYVEPIEGRRLEQKDARLIISSTVSHHTSVVLSNFSVTARTSVPVSSQRRDSVLSAVRSARSTR